MTKHPLEQLADTNPDAEIWWDSSPLIYPSWEKETLAKAPEGKRAEWEAQLDRFYDPETVASQGTMGFRGVTTNPPLSLQAIQVDPQGWRQAILDIAKRDSSLDVEGVYWAMYLDLVKRGADAIRPVYDKSGGKYGYLSGQVDPRFVTDGEAMLQQGLTIAEQATEVMDEFLIMADHSSSFPSRSAPEPPHAGFGRDASYGCMLAVHVTPYL